MANDGAWRATSLSVEEKTILVSNQRLQDTQFSCVMTRKASPGSVFQSNYDF